MSRTRKAAKTTEAGALTPPAALQRTIEELTQAFDATLEGWSRAVELRANEPVGHTARVTEVTVKLAREMGLGGATLEHIRRGSLLHDIGTMRIPEGILLKPAPLTDDELQIMRQHPVHARELLSAVPFLGPALDIPHSHHEKWDGTGYPLGLRMDEIPLAARIFAVVDVWDAMRSDRPYRRAWPEKKVRLYIREQAHSHFDPRVVDAFLKMGMR